jgi:hypothetical protein
MATTHSFIALLCALLLSFSIIAQPAAAQVGPAGPPAPTATKPGHTQTQTSPAVTSATPTGSSTGGGSGANETGILTGPPDVLLHVPTLSVGRIELDVEDLEANINLNAKVANLVTINAGVAVSVQKVNITISDIDAELELTVRLGHLVDIVNRVFQSLDLNPLLLTALNNVTSIVDDVVGEVDGLLGSITQGGNTLSFVIDNLGNIVQQVASTSGSGNPVSSIVGNYLSNMTFTGVEKPFSGGLTQKQYSYSPLSALVDIVFNTAGQVVQATVEKNSGSSTSTPTPSATPTGAARRWSD